MAKMDKVKFLSDVEIEGKLTVTPKPSEGLAYALSEDETYAICTGIGTCTDTHLVIAGSYKGRLVTQIANGAFFDPIKDLNFTSVIIPNSVTSIGESAFAYCTSLESIIIPNSVTRIGNEAFEWCTSLTIYCEAKEQPEGWHSNWNPNNRPVIWDYAPDIPAINDRIISIENNIGDIESALDAILAIQKELIGTPTIIFTINGVEYTAIEGMTWGEWVDSEYNIDGWYVDSDSIQLNLRVLAYPNEEIVLPIDVIVANTAYHGK